MLANHRIKFFADFIEKELGIIYAEHVYYQLQQRLEKVAEHLGIKDVDTLYDQAVEKGITGESRAFLLDISTNNETSFFRDTSIYNALENFIFPQLKKDFPTVFTYRIWSAASSTGQEPYSVAMLAHEARQQDPTLPRIEIKGTDISDKALARCRAGRYSQLEISRGLSPARLDRYFTKTEDSHFQVKPDISSLVDFTKQNLLDGFSNLGKFHIIMCRYVLIYQDTAKKKQILGRLVNALHPRGFLIMGGSESAIGLSTDLEQVEFKGAVFYRAK